MKKIVLSLMIILSAYTLQANEDAGFPLAKSPNQLCDKASLQRGAKLYMNYCAGCHSLQYVRFKNMAKDIGIVDKDGTVLEELVNKNLNFVSENINDTIVTALPKKEAEQWFGVAPPDLSLVARSRGKDWIYTYLRSFYVDPKRPWGMNNAVFPDVGMPHVLQGLQGTQVPVFTETTHKAIDHFTLQSPGSLTVAEYDKAVADLVNFLEYVGEPHKLERKRLGVWVLLFLVIFTLFAYLLKREYWKDIH